MQGLFLKNLILKKGSFYKNAFPINEEPLSIDTISQVKLFYEKIKAIDGTNIEKFIEYCFSLLELMP